MARIIDHSKVSFWTQLLQRFSHSGLSIAEFCRQQDVATHNFHYWTKRLKLEPSFATATPSAPSPANVCPPPVIVLIHSDDRLQVNLPTDRTDILYQLVRQFATRADGDHPTRDATAATKFKQIVVRPSAHARQA